MNYNTYSYSGYNTYREIGVKTASQGKLVVMLYDGAVTNLQSALSLVDDSNKVEASSIETFGKHLQKTQDIITELQISLDMEKGGEIAQNLMALYIYFNKELLSCSLTHDKKKMKFILNLLSELRDSWASVSQTQANGTVRMQNERASSLSITG